MKILYILLMMSDVSLAKEYHFVFNLQNRDRLEYKTDAPNWDKAFDRAFSFCSNFLINREPLTESRIAYITDVCANPGERNGTKTQ